MFYALPPEIELDIQTILNELSPEEVQYFKEHCLIHFPAWLHTMTRKEASIQNKTFEQFVRDACVSALMECIKQRQTERN